MSPRLTSQSGLTLIEVLVGLASLTLVVGTFLEVTNLRNSLLSRVKSTYDLGDVVIANVDEVKAKTFTLLPTPGNCLVRIYDRYGIFTSENLVPSTSPACAQQPLTTDTMEVVWRVSGASDIAATFSPSAFLKLPKNKASIVQIEIVGRVKAPPPGPSQLTLSAVIFRK